MPDLIPSKFEWLAGRIRPISPAALAKDDRVRGLKRSFTKPRQDDLDGSQRPWGAAPRRNREGRGAGAGRDPSIGVSVVRTPVTLFTLAAVALALATTATSAKDPISVMIDRAKVMRISAPAATVVIGNPAIADASIQDRQTLVVTGRVTGITNLVILDAKGELIADELINVEKPDKGYVTVQRGAGRYTYSCTPSCNVALEPGDQSEHFTSANTQMLGRHQFVQSAAGGSN